MSISLSGSIAPPDPAEETRLDERARCSGIVRELARAAAVHAAVARHVMRIAAMTGDADELIKKGQRLKELIARAEAFAEAVRAIEEDGET